MVKVALLIGVSESGSGFSKLSAATKDVVAMQQLLQEPEIGGFDEVKVLMNPDRQVMEEGIYELFVNRNKDDLVLLYFSGHGIKDDSGNLYLATSITRKEQEKFIQPTAVSASFIQDKMSSSSSRCKRQVVILDCCFSGAFSEGMKVKDDGSIPIEQQLGGEGRAILTSSTSVQYSFEHEGFELSLYTHFLVEGLKTGVADLDNDGNISIDEIHTYTSQKVKETVPGKMKPEIYPVKEGYKIILAKARVNDPQQEYRKAVERYAKCGVISEAARKLLDIKKDNLNITFRDAQKIEDEVLKPYNEYKRKLKIYKDAFYDMVKNLHPIDNNIINDFKLFQQSLGIIEKDAIKIQQEILLSKEIESLITLANEALDKRGIEHFFIKNKRTSPECIAYQAKQPRESEQLYDLVFIQRNDGLYIYIAKQILNDSLLQIQCWEYDQVTDDMYTSVKGIFWILPNKAGIFINSLHPVYTELLKSKVTGKVYLNQSYIDYEYGSYHYDEPKFSLVEFPLTIMSNRSDTYLTVKDNKLFSGTWEVCIKSREILEEVIDYLYQQMLMQGLLQPLSSTTQPDDVPLRVAAEG